VSWFDAAWRWYSANATVINPIGTFVGAVLGFTTAAILAWAGLKNARTAARRHEEQTKADRQRRITESFSKATEQLASEKIEARLGGIYTLERISRESPDDYRVVMETLTAFVREHARWKEPDKIASDTSVNLYDDENSEAPQPEPATDVAAVLAVINRRDYPNPLEGVVDFRGCDLRGAFLGGTHLERTLLWRTHLEGAMLGDAHLEGASLMGAHLEGAMLVDAHLEGANLIQAHLEEANLSEGHLEGASLMGAHLEGANLVGAHLEGANLSKGHLEGADLGAAHLEGANLSETRLEGADLGAAEGLVQDQIIRASGNSGTILPGGLKRPQHWTRATVTQATRCQSDPT
jgi:uncharacterized protein YjbI with pentapeptide repeats